MGAIWRPPRRLSVAGVRWSTVQASTGAAMRIKMPRQTRPSKICPEPGMSSESQLAGEASEGQYCSLPGVPLEQMPGGKTFGDAFSAKYGQIQLYAPYVYDATMVMVDAMKRANSVESAKFLPEIGKTDYQGVTAKIQFDEKGDLKGGAISLYQVKAGKWEYRETVGGAPAAPKAEGEKK